MYIYNIQKLKYFDDFNDFYKLDEYINYLINTDKSNISMNVYIFNIQYTEEYCREINIKYLEILFTLLGKYDDIYIKEKIQRHKSHKNILSLDDVLEFV